MSRPPLTKPTNDSSSLTPAEIVSRIASQEGLVWFDSSLEKLPHGRLSMIGLDPEEVVSGSAAEWNDFEKEFQKRRVTAAPDCGYPTGGAAGWVDYDGNFVFGFYPKFSVYDHAAASWLTHPPDLSLSQPTPDSNLTVGRFVPQLSKADYLDMVQTALDYIAAGDIYQVNLSHSFLASLEGNPLALYEALRFVSPTAFSAYMDLKGTQVLSSSPESFLKMSGRGIQSRPIKGTRPRKRDPQADDREACDLVTSKKEIAELVMITDLIRNDLGRVCEYGSVTVPELLVLERYEQVFHLVSTVQGTLRETISHPAAFRSCFPGGSITGAPKIRAMEIICELEKFPRGLYTGATGFFGYNGESQFNIAIRTITIHDRQAEFHVGAGIVSDSNPEREWEETLHKASGMIQAAEWASNKQS